MTEWIEYLRHFIEEGFSEEGISDLLGDKPDSDSILLVQQRLEDSKKLIASLDSAPKLLNDAANEMKKRLLQRPSELDDIRAKYNAMVVGTSPWIATADKMKDQWSMEGRSIELSAWIRRLSSIDYNSPNETKAVIQAIENISPRDEVRKAIETLESKQRERELILRDMVNILERKGWEIQFTENANLAERFEEAAQWLELEDRIDALEKEIVSFEKRRPAAARIGLQIIVNSRIKGDVNAITELERAVKDEFQDIQERNHEIHQRVNHWSEKGLIIFDSAYLTDEQLFELDENLERLENHWETVVKNCIILRELLDELNMEYPQWLGRVDSNEMMLEMIGDLQQQQQLMSNEINQILEHWTANGLSLEFIDILALKNEIKNNNNLEIKRLETLATMAISMMESINYLDFSMDNERIREIQKSIIQGWHNDNTLEFELEEIEKISRRQERHLVMLYQRAEDISMDVSKSKDWTLAEFEDLLFDAEMNRDRDFEKQAKKKSEIMNKKISEKPSEIIEENSIDSSSEMSSKNENWIEKEAADGKSFFYNKQTKESTWVKPEGYKKLEDIPLAKENHNLRKEELEDKLTNFDSQEDYWQDKTNEDSEEIQIEIVEEEKVGQAEPVKTKEDKQSVFPFRERLGIGNTDPLNIEASRPRDLRIQRLLRLIPLIESECSLSNQFDLVQALNPLLDNIEKWVQVRSEYRRCWDDDGGIIDKIDRLQNILDKVPGPGIQLPIGHDEKPLPTTTDNLITEIKDLSINALVSTSGGGIIAL